MNPSILQTIQLMASIASSEKLDKKVREIAEEVLRTLIPLVKEDAVKLSLANKNITV